jgi:hypothetical protein
MLMAPSDSTSSVSPSPRKAQTLRCSALAASIRPRLEVLHEARLVDGLDRAEAHRDGRELPEVRHQPRVRVGRNALAAGFLAEVVHLLLGQAAEHEGAGIDAGHRVALEEDQVATGFVLDALPEMRKADVIERGGRGERGDVAADIGVLVGAHDHRHGVPADVGVDLDLHVAIARVLGLLVDRNGVDVFGVGRVGQAIPLRRAWPITFSIRKWARSALPAR